MTYGIQINNPSGVSKITSDISGAFTANHNEILNIGEEYNIYSLLPTSPTYNKLDSSNGCTVMVNNAITNGHFITREYYIDGVLLDEVNSENKLSQVCKLYSKEFTGKTGNFLIGNKNFFGSDQYVSGGYGIQLFNENENVIFDSTYPILSYSSFINTQLSTVYTTHTGWTDCTTEISYMKPADTATRRYYIYGIKKVVPQYTNQDDLYIKVNNQSVNMLSESLVSYVGGYPNLNEYRDYIVPLYVGVQSGFVYLVHIWYENYISALGTWEPFREPKEWRIDANLLIFEKQ